MPITIVFPRFFKKLYIFSLILAIELVLTGCNTGIAITTKEVRNKTTGNIEEYRSIKIDEDKENEYYLDIKIPPGYKKARTQYSKWLTVYRFSKGESNRHSREGFLIYTSNKKYKDIYSYSAWLDQHHKKSKGKPISRNYSYAHAFADNGYSVRTKTLEYIFPCSYMKAGVICFADQKEISILKAIKTKQGVWTVEYGNMVYSANKKDYDERVEKFFKDGQKIIKNCCKIVIVKKK